MLPCSTCVASWLRLALILPLRLRLGAAKHFVLRVRSIGEGARLTVADDRHGTPRLRRRQERPQGYVAGSPVAQNANGREVATPAQTTTTTAIATHTTTTGMATAASMPTTATRGTATTAAANMLATTATSGMAATAAFEGSGGVGQPATQEAAP